MNAQVSVWNQNHDRTFYAEELSENSVALLLFNLSIRGMNAYVRCGDVLTNNFKSVYKLTRNGNFSDIEKLDGDVNDFTVNTVISNPPFSIKFQDAEAVKQDQCFREYGIPPTHKADYGFVLRGLSRLSDGGTMVFILPHGVLFRGGKEAQIRQRLIQANLLDAVIGLPAGLFLNTQIPVCILVFKKGRKYKDILFIDAKKEFKKSRKQNFMNENHIRRLLDTYKHRDEVQRYSHRAYLDEIKENDYNLNIPRYVDSFIPPEPVDIGKVVDDIARIEDEISNVEKELAEMMNCLTGNEQYLTERNKAAEYLKAHDPHIVSDSLVDMNKMIEKNSAALRSQKEIALLDVSTFERSRKNKIYPKGSILLQLSASEGELVYLDKEGKAESKYGVIQTEGIDSKYLYYVLQIVLPGFLRRFQTGLNINPDILKMLRFDVHTEKSAQRMVVAIMDNMQFLADEQSRSVGQWKQFKQYHLDNMFV